jgi:hypothetical protein
VFRHQVLKGQTDQQCRLRLGPGGRARTVALAAALAVVIMGCSRHRPRAPAARWLDRQKYPWWTVGTTGEFTIQGRRLDASAPPLHAQINSGVPQNRFAEVPGARFWASGISFPTRGCWQVTGRVGRTTLAFVVFVAEHA